MTQLLRLISTNEITMLKDMNNIIDIDLSGRFRHFYIPNLELIGIQNFIMKLEDNTIFCIIPVISMFGKDSAPHLILSKQILISRNSSSKLIHDYLNYQLDIAISDFGIANLENGDYLIFTQ